MNRTQRLALSVVLALSTTVAVANAQPAGSQRDQGYGSMMGPWMMGPNGMMGGGPMGPWMMGPNYNGSNGPMCNMMNYQMPGRLAYLKAELQITPAQEPLWKAYADAVQSNALTMTSRCTSMMGGSAWNALSLPDRLTKHEQFMAAQLEVLRVIDKSLKPLYATFSDDQKQAADQLIWCPMGMM